MKRRQFLTETTAAVGVLAIGNLSGPYLGLFAEEKDFFTVEILKVDCPNTNERIYSKAAIEKAISDFQPGKMFGELWDGNGHYRTVGSISLNNMSHEIKRIYLEDNRLMADVKIMNTPRGRDLKSLMAIDENSISFRPFGISDSKDENEFKDGAYIIKNYKLISIDAMPTSIAAKW